MEVFKSIIKRKSWWYLLADNSIYQKLRHTDHYQSYLKEISFYKSLIGTANKLIFDVGAHIGTKSKIFSLLSQKVILFEPDPKNLKILNARLKFNSRCIVNDCALSSSKSIAKYYSIKKDSAYNSLSEKHINTVVKSRKIINNNYQLAEYDVKTNTLDFFIDKYGTPDYIKIDVEGFEKEVILGLNVPVPLISIEANLPQFLPETNDIINYLDRLSSGQYLYNYVVADDFELKEFVSANEVISILPTVSVKSIEVYCYLNSSTKSLDS